MEPRHREAPLLAWVSRPMAGLVSPGGPSVSLAESLTCQKVRFSHPKGRRSGPSHAGRAPPTPITRSGVRLLTTLDGSPSPTLPSPGSQLPFPSNNHPPGPCLPCLPSTSSYRFYFQNTNMAASRGLMTPINETEHSVSRISREGKKITYNLKVIQQPERARACGAGAKSSADRRPVDPPPVVELRVFESDPENDMNPTDITFAYNANFFLFATLDNARPIAHGRVDGQPPTCPVLTGVPVAGIAYLDRPSQTGYFIFPDLSVRHEGFYRLNFNLYEEVKDGKDLDKDTPMPSRESLTPSSKPTAPKTFLNFRLEVKSTPFQVYSAKKFPGLATSTTLSRVVAEQGCRVRIRRDVRMRRRGEKGGKDYGDFEDDRYARSSRYTTPSPIERPRSTSNSTVETPYAYAAQPQRRDSISDFHASQALPPPPPPHSTFQPPPPSAPPATTPGYLSFGSALSYQTPQLPATPVAPIAPHTPVFSHATSPHSRNSSNASERETISQSYPTRSHLPPILNPKPIDPPAFGDTPDRMAYQPSQPATRPRTPSLMLPPISSLGQFSSPAPIHDSQRKPFYPIETSLTKRSHDDSFGRGEHLAHKSIRSENEHAMHADKRDSLEAAPRWEGSSMEYRRANGTMTTKNSYYIDVEVEFDPLQTDPMLQFTEAHKDDNNNNNKNDNNNSNKPEEPLPIHKTPSDAIVGEMNIDDKLIAHKRKLSLVEASDDDGGGGGNNNNNNHNSNFASPCSSDTSGRFDDANESDAEMTEATTTAATATTTTPTKTTMLAVARKDDNNDEGEEQEEKGETRSVHSAKRGRSNGWPLQNEIAYDENGMRIKQAPKNKSAISTDGDRVVRQSRFIEGSMNDRVSQKPPSIFFQDEQLQQQQHHQSQEDGGSTKRTQQNVEKRSSGIFRFGKAIASAFHPFGSWNSNTTTATSNNNAGKSQKDVMKQRQVRAEKAYAELKKSGFKGMSSFSSSTAAASNNKVDANVADQTWKAIQAKMDYKLPGESSRSSSQEQQQGETLVPPKGVSKFKSFSELRKRTSTLSIPAMRARDVSSPLTRAVPGQGESEQQQQQRQRQVERRQSRKELNRQAKLMKRVSNLEDKLLRARRELREFSVFEHEQNKQQQQEKTVVPTICVDDCVNNDSNNNINNNNKPGLPTVLSERVLEEQGMLLSDAEYETMLQQPPRAKWPPVDSLSRKPTANTDGTPAIIPAADEETDMEMEIYDADCGKPTTTTNTKESKVTKPKPNHKENPETSTGSEIKKPKANRDKRASSLTTKASQRLKAKQSSRNLRQTTPNSHTEEDKNNKPPLQQQEGNNASRSPGTSPAAAAAAGAEWTYNGAENIPPVPPVPKEILQQFANGTGKEEPKRKGKDSKRVPSRGFAWPEDIF
ncbi:Titin [Talaromyces islandicus]|uniref:Developmental and secondary metabolism regulator veA n=1 Tax=Talaromyces islandicus TaxID=28573 RepID=A0A0U1M2D5_TALIS|nr:Titin [Talaromyces islandicus]